MRGFKLAALLPVAKKLFHKFSSGRKEEKPHTRTAEDPDLRRSSKSSESDFSR
jgi:hypothetical protein